MFPDFLNQDSTIVAKRLIGCELIREFDEGVARVRIVETESYDQNDPASHTFRGKTPRNSTMFGPNGLMYVYFTYGMHYCCNIVAGEEGYGSGVLIRAVEPLEGEDLLYLRRPITGKILTNGPGKLTKALDIDLSMNGHDLRQSPLRLESAEPYPDGEIITSTRIGIRHAAQEPRRFYLSTSDYISKR